GSRAARADRRRGVPRRAGRRERPGRDRMSAGHDPADGAERPSLLTRRGGTLAGATAGLLVGSRLLGADELAVLAVAGIVIIGAAVAWTRLRRVRLVARRVQQPARLQVGGSGRIELELTNLGRRPTPLLLVADGFDDGR